MSTRIKGASLINTIVILREALGANRFQAAVATCPPSTQQLVKRTLVAVEWIPLEDWAPFIEAIFDQICRKDEHQFRRLMRAVCKRDFSTVYRVYLNQATPQEILEKTSSIWAAYFDGGSLSLDTSGSVGGRPQMALKMRDLETTSRLYAIIMHAYLEQLLIMAGAQNSKVQRGKEQLQNGKLSCDYLIDLGT